MPFFLMRFSPIPMGSRRQIVSSFYGAKLTDFRRRFPVAGIGFTRFRFWLVSRSKASCTVVGGIGSNLFTRRDKAPRLFGRVWIRWSIIHPSMRETTQFGRNVHTTPATAPCVCLCGQCKVKRKIPIPVNVVTNWGKEKRGHFHRPLVVRARQK